MKEYIKKDLLILIRNPTYMIVTILIPVLLFLFYGRSNAEQVEYIAASFCAFSVFGIVFFQFGVSISSDRDSYWYKFTRTLPGSMLNSIVSRIVTAILLSVVSITIIMIVSGILFNLGSGKIITLYTALILGAIPFSLMGAALGYLIPPKLALPIANLIYLVLSFIGGLWTPPSNMSPEILQIAQFTPTFHWGTILWSTIEGVSPPPLSILVLVIYSVILALLTYIGYRKDEGTQYQ